jgi:hypothetical protein
MRQHRRETLRRRRIRELVRQFKENGMKLMLEHPANVQDLLRLLHLPWFDEIDFGRLQQMKTTFVRRDYRNLELHPTSASWCIMSVVRANSPDCSR